MSEVNNSTLLAACATCEGRCETSSCDANLADRSEALLRNSYCDQHCDNHHHAAMERLFKHTANIPGFSIVETYQRLLAEDPDLAMPVAAIESLILLLQQSSVTTVFETMDLLHAQSKYLKSHVKNPISLTAGTELFIRYINRSFSTQKHGTTFETVRQQLIDNAHTIVERSKLQRAVVADNGYQLIRDGSIVLTHGGSRTVGAILAKAAEVDDTRGSTRFRVIYVINGARAAESADAVDKLRAKGIPVSVISEGAVAYAMGKVSMVIVGAEGVVESGGIVSRMGTNQIAQLAKSMKKPFYVAVETSKFVRFYPLDQYDLPVKQEIISFMTEADVEAKRVKEMEEAAKAAKDKAHESKDGEYFGAQPANAASLEDYEKKSTIEKLLGSDAADAVDYTPPDLIAALITESGIMTPPAVSESLLQIYIDS